MQGRVEPPHKNQSKGPAPNICPCRFWEAETTCRKEAENSTSFLGNGHDLTLKEACGNFSSSLSFAHKYTKRQDREGTTPLVLTRGKTDRRITSVCLPRWNKPEIMPYAVTPVVWVGDRETPLNHFQTFLEFTEESQSRTVAGEPSSCLLPRGCIYFGIWKPDLQGASPEGASSCFPRPGSLSLTARGAKRCARLLLALVRDMQLLGGVFECCSEHSWAV